MTCGEVVYDMWLGRLRHSAIVYNRECCMPHGAVVPGGIDHHRRQSSSQKACEQHNCLIRLIAITRSRPVVNEQIHTLSTRGI